MKYKTKDQERRNLLKESLIKNIFKRAKAHLVKQKINFKSNVNHCLCNCLNLNQLKEDLDPLQWINKFKAITWINSKEQDQ